jgi:exodeoxyribonuclease V alpha subunit
VVIVDEASMIDGAMMAKLMDAIAPVTRFYLIGDKDQLASVEAGSVFGDICRAADSALLHDKVQVQQKNYRAINSPRLMDFSKRVINGDKSILHYENNEEVTIDTIFSERMFREKVFLYKDYLLDTDIKTALKNLNAVRFLCVTRDADHSVLETNRKVEAILAREINDKDIFLPRGTFYHNQPIIITRNDYNLGLMNGDVGIIRRGSTGLEAYFETSDGEIKSIPAGYLSDYETAFAMTIHKSQGSEFENVVVLLPEKRAGKLLTRELLYTGVTRARKNVLIQTTIGVLEICLDQRVSRASGLTERIQNLQP